MTTTLEDVKAVLKANLSLEGVDIDAIDANAPLFPSLGLDSLDAIELVIILRKNYDILIENMAEGRPAFQTLETLRKFIEDKRKK